MGAAWEATSEGGGGDDSIRTFLPCVSAGGNIVWSGDMGAHRGNDSVVIGSACEFLQAGRT